MVSLPAAGPGGRAWRRSREAAPPVRRPPVRPD